MSENEYIPRFERDLQKAGGSLNALAERRRTGKNDLNADTENSGLRSLLDGSENADTVFENGSVSDGSFGAELTEEDLPNIDFVYGNDDYDPNASIESITADNIVLGDMDEGRVRLEDMRTPKNSAASTLKAQMMEFDMANEVIGERASLREMSEKYATRTNRSDLLSKAMLDRNEKEALKNQLKEEIYSKPEGFNQRRSMEMYHKLMDEQNAKEAQRGFFMLLVLAAMGLAIAALEYFLKLNPDGSVSGLYMNYIHIATILFSILMLIKTKFFKVLSAIYFIVNTFALIVPGLMVYAMDPVNQEGGESGSFILHIFMFVIAIILSAVVFIRLIKDKTVAAYYSYSKSR